MANTEDGADYEMPMLSYNTEHQLTMNFNYDYSMKRYFNNYNTVFAIRWF